MRKVILYIAMTLDGYIAKENDDLSFLSEYEANPEITESFNDLENRIDTYLLGRKTYDVIKNFDPWPYQNKAVYVISSHDILDDKIISYHGDLSLLIQKLKEEKGKDIWLVGGGVLIKSMMDHDLIDEYQITIIPKTLSSGIPLFPKGIKETTLKLDSVKTMGELVHITYKHI